MELSGELSSNEDIPNGSWDTLVLIIAFLDDPDMFTEKEAYHATGPASSSETEKRGERIGACQLKGERVRGDWPT